MVIVFFLFFIVVVFLASRLVFALLYVFIVLPVISVCFLLAVVFEFLLLVSRGSCFFLGGCRCDRLLNSFLLNCCNLYRCRRRPAGVDAVQPVAGSHLRDQCFHIRER